MSLGPGGRAPMLRPIVRQPEWTEGNQHDPGITIVVLMAWLATALLVLWLGRRHRRLPCYGPAVPHR